MDFEIGKGNVGRIAERIVANELEYRGYRVSDLNKEGLSANADLLASNHTGTLQIQVKGASNKPKERDWVGYGHCTEAMIAGTEPVFNRRKSFYAADIVALVAVRSPGVYKCVLLPVEKAEEAAQANLDRYYRIPKRDGGVKKVGKMWVYLEPSLKERITDKRALRFFAKERNILRDYCDWKLLKLLNSKRR